MLVFQASLFLRLPTTLPSVAVRDVSNVSERGTQRPNTFKYARSVSNGFLNASAKPIWLIWSDPKNYSLSVRMSKGNIGRLETKVAFSSDRKLLAIP